MPKEMRHHHALPMAPQLTPVEPTLDCSLVDLKVFLNRRTIPRALKRHVINYFEYFWR